MTAYNLEAGFCFQPRVTAFAEELASACAARAGLTEGSFSAWTDGTYWRDNDGVTLVGWIEPDGVTLYPPAEIIALVNA